MSSGRILYFSRLKAMGCIAVVLLHTFYAAAAYAKNKDQLAAMNAVRNAMMWAVPCFVMVTGALLLDKDKELTYKKLFCKLILRMAISLIVFSVLFACFDAWLISKDFSLDTVTGGLKTTLYGGGWKHMWYLYLMIALYLLMPAYRLVTKSAQRKDIIYLTAVYAVFLTVLPTVESLTGKDIAFYICAYSVYPLYLFLGYAMHNGMIKPGTVISGIMALAGLGLVIGLTVWSTGKGNKTESLLGNYSFIIYALLSAGIFGLIQSAGNKPVKVLDLIAGELEKCSFGIYLLHMAVLKLVLVVWGFDPFAHGGAVTVLGISLAILAVSYAIVRLLKLIPFVNRII